MILNKKILRFSSKQCLLLTGMIFIEFVFTALLYKTLKTREEQIHHAIFVSQAKEITASISKEITVNLEKVISLEALYNVAYPVSRDKFRTFTRHLIHSDTTIQALSWIPKITKKERRIFEMQNRETGLENYYISEKKGESLFSAELRNEYFPVDFIEPLRGNEKALGFDVASSPVRLKAMKKADATNQLILTEPINLIQGNSSEKGVLAFYPFKKNGELLGYFSGVFKIEDLISKSSQTIGRNDFQFKVSDISSEKYYSVLLDVTTEKPSESNFSILRKPKIKTFRQGIKVADRNWLIEIIPSEKYLNLKSETYWLILLLCIVISIGLCYHLISHFRSENLLLNILPYEVARELKTIGKSEARDFERVSILFTDFSDFTKISTELSAHELVNEINIYFEAFDGIVEKYGLEKIKTIGDSYMAAGGLPIPRDDSVKNIVLAAIDMQQFVMERKRSNDMLGKPSFSMRAGIHTGEVAAGIVGSWKFQYDIWGDAVNTASRMESKGKVDLVNISQTTYELLKDDQDLIFEYRGKVKAKGKGIIDMWFVNLKNKRSKKSKLITLGKIKINNKATEMITR